MENGLGIMDFTMDHPSGSGGSGGRGGDPLNQPRYHCLTPDAPPSPTSSPCMHDAASSLFPQVSVSGVAGPQRRAWVYNYVRVWRPSTSAIPAAMERHKARLGAPP
jgi:hypothetical protein